MSITVSEIVSDAISRYPKIGLLDDSTIARKLTAIERNMYQYIGTIAQKDVTVNSSGAYSVDTDFRVDNMVAVLWYSQSEGGSAVDGASYYEEPDIDSLRIPYCEDKIALTYRGGDYTVATVFYKPIPELLSSDSSTWDLTFLHIDDQYAEILVYKLVQELAVYGDIPDISISNNYERMYLESFAKAKADFYKRKQRNSTKKIKHEDIW